MHVLARFPSLAYATPPVRCALNHHAVAARVEVHVAGIGHRQCAALSTRFDHVWLHETALDGMTAAPAGSAAGSVISDSQGAV